VFVLFLPMYHCIGVTSLPDIVTLLTHMASSPSMLSYLCMNYTLICCACFIVIVSCAAEVYCWWFHPSCCVCHPSSSSDTNTSLEACSPQVSRRSKELQGNVFSRLTSQLRMSSSHPSRWLTLAPAAVSTSC